MKNSVDYQKDLKQVIGMNLIKEILPEKEDEQKELAYQHHNQKNIEIH